jgi:hypothetical protein
MTATFGLRHQGCFTSSNYKLPSQGLCGDEQRVFPELLHLKDSEDLHHAAVHTRKRRRLAVKESIPLPRDVLELILTRVST